MLSVVFHLEPDNEQEQFSLQIKLVRRLSRVFFCSHWLCCSPSIWSILQRGYIWVFNLPEAWLEYLSYVSRVEVSIVERLVAWFVLCVVKILLHVVIRLSLKWTQGCKTGGKISRIRIEFVSLVFLKRFTFINLNSFTCGNALYAENLITVYPVFAWVRLSE